jgi:uncharacterized protein YjbJ (UPF0337 family)
LLFSAKGVKLSAKEHAYVLFQRCSLEYIALPVSIPTGAAASRTRFATSGLGSNWRRSHTQLAEPPTRVFSRERHPGGGKIPRLGILRVPRAYNSLANRSDFMGINKDQVEGRVKEAAGKVQEVAGKALGSATQQAKGMTTKVAGAAQAKFGDAKETVKENYKDATRRP